MSAPNIFLNASREKVKYPKPTCEINNKVQLTSGANWIITHTKKLIMKRNYHNGKLNVNSYKTYFLFIK